MNGIQDINTVAARTLPTSLCLKTLHPGRKKSFFKGQTTVEFAFICLPFFAILFALVDYAQIYFYENSLQNAMREACRFATAGRIIPSYHNDNSQVYETNLGGVVLPTAINDDQGREASRNECIRYWFNSNCVIHLPISNITIVSASTLPGVPPDVASNNTAGKGVLLSGYTYTFTTNSAIPLNVTTNTHNVPAVPGPGGQNDYIQISAEHTISTITPLVGFLGGFNTTSSGQSWFTYTVRVSAIVKNESSLLNFLHTNRYSDEPFNSNWLP